MSISAMHSVVPSVSVLLPAYNAESTINEAVSSIVGQTLTDIEVLILNDGSTDGTADIVRRLAAVDGRIRYVEHPNMGLVATLNRGLDLAKAKLIARMDADDIAVPNRLELQLAYLSDKEDIVLVGSGIIVCSSDMTPLDEVRLPCDSDQIREHLLCHGNAFAHPTVMFRKSAVINAGGYNPYFAHAEDYALWLELSEKYQLSNLDASLVRYRKSSTSVSHKHLLQQVISELCARLIANRGLSLLSFKDCGVANIDTVVSFGGTVDDVKELYIARGGTKARWDMDIVTASKAHISTQHIFKPVRRSLASLDKVFAVSAILPAYNHETYLLSAIESALLCPQVKEVLVVDDGSKDATLEVIREATLLDSRVRNISCHPSINRGAHIRLNELVSAASFPTIAILNSDDLFCVDRFDLLEKVFCEGNEFAFGNLLIIDEHNTVMWTKRGPYTTNDPFPENLDVATLVDKNEILPLLCHQNFAGTTSNFVFTKDLWKRVGGFRDFRYVHDWDFIIRSFINGKCTYVDSYLSSYRFHSTNTISENTSKVAMEIKNMAATILDEFGASDRGCSLDMLKRFL